ncbi:acyl transferase [Parasediminibacterium sp. JCM 36343]|uniref:LuxE/PaaK family acyltransferase n=1 Tax=Parasediminibacterium sp. JCM 36343 TaxID=3374279 RepID=UPI00397D8CAF
MEDTIINNIFSVTPENFDAVAHQVFQFQVQENLVYGEWAGLVSGQWSVLSVKSLHPTSAPYALSLTPYPFLPISFFKSHVVAATQFEPGAIFESSGTTHTINSKHLIKDLSIYRQSFLTAFQLFYENINEWCIIGLLPSYLERGNSSLVMMADALIKLSNHPNSGFYLNDLEGLQIVLQQLEAKQQKTLLIGVTFALLDFAEQYPMQLKNTVVMETGGMKGRRRELTRAEVHHIISNGLGVEKVHSEYGMTELLSQAYSAGDGRFVCPPWMKVFVRAEDDPLDIKPFGKGVLNIIDLANLYSCSFIATDDVGIVYEDGSFEVWGRLDNSDIRGCSLLVV